MTRSASSPRAETCGDVLLRLRGFVTQEEERALATELGGLAYPAVHDGRPSDFPLSVQLLSDLYDGSEEYDAAFRELESLEVRLLVNFDEVATVSHGLRDSAPLPQSVSDRTLQHEKAALDENLDDDEYEEDEEHSENVDEDGDEAEEVRDREYTEQTPPTGDEAERFVAWVARCRSDDSDALGADARVAASWVSLANDAQISRRLRSRALSTVFVRISTASADPRADEAVSRYRTIRAGLVETNVRLALSFAPRHRGSLAPSEALGVAVTGLMRGIDGYEPEIGFRLATYAVHWIKQSLVHANMDYSSPIRTPIHLRETVQRARAATRTMDGAATAALSASELAELIDSDVGTAEEARAAARFVSFGDCSFGGVADLDTTVDTRRLTPSDGGRDAEVGSRLVTLESHLHETLRALEAQPGESERKVARGAQLREILDARLAIGRRGRAVLASIGTMYGVTRERIRQLEKIALKLAHAALRRGTSGSGGE